MFRLLESPFAAAPKKDGPPATPPPRAAQFAAGDLQTRMAAATDPAVKLALWDELAKKEALADAAASHAVQSGLVDDALELETRKETTAVHAWAEVDEEVLHMMHDIANGQPVTTADVDDLIERKRLEREIERKYNINLSNDIENKPATPSDDEEPTDRIVWTKQELEQLAETLDDMPDDMVVNQTNFDEIRRARVDRDWDETSKTWDTMPNIRGESGSETIRIYDQTFAPGNVDSHTGHGSDLAGHDPVADPVSMLDETLTHEIGHAVDAGNRSAAAEDFKSMAGWRETDADEVYRLLGQSTLSLQDSVVALGDLLHDKRVAIDGRVYRIKDGKLISFIEGAIPDDGAIPYQPPSVTDFSTYGTWSSAKNTAGDHFAETYMKAVQTPELLYQDLVETPAQTAEAMSAVFAGFDAQLASMQASGAPPAVIAAVEQQRHAYGVAMTRAALLADLLREQHRIMREEVFGMNDAKVESAAEMLAARLEETSPEVAQALTDEFRERARAAMTDEQLLRLQEEYEGRSLLP